MLEEIGLGGDEERVYLALLRQPARTTEELAARLGLSAEAVAGPVERLAGRGLLTVDSGGHDRLRVVPPDLALSPLLLRRQVRLQRARDVVARLAGDYQARAALHAPETVAETVVGQAAVADSYTEIQRAARAEVRVLVGGPAITPGAGPAGVRRRVVYERALLAEPGGPLRLPDSPARGEEPRVTERVPLWLAIADDRAAFLPAVGAHLEEPAAVIVRSGPLLAALDWIFETVWQGAVPFPQREEVPPGSAPAAADRQLLSLLLSGCTDRAIAGQLGVSVRTVQRRVSRLCAEVGAGTRLQLVWQATRRGWL